MATPTIGSVEAPSALESVFRAYEEGHSALLLTGRSLCDLTVDDDGRLRPLLEVLRRQIRGAHGLHLVTYSLAEGLLWDAGLEDERDRAAVERALRAHRLLEVSQDEHEAVRVMRAVSMLCRTPAGPMAWAAGGQPIRFAFLFDFAEHLTPRSNGGCAAEDAQLVAIELAHLTGQSLALRASGNLVLFNGREGLIDDLVAAALRRVHLRQPDGDEKLRFVSAGMRLYTKARLEDGLAAEGVVHLTTNTPNRGVEQLLRAAERTGRPVTARDLVAQKSRDVEQLSEGTLTLLDVSRIEGTNLCGLNIAVPKANLERYGAALLRGDRAMPGAILLAGAPGSGKTELAVLTAHLAKVPAFQMHSPKSGIVGETERRARLQQTVLREWLPNIAFVDEITEAFPLQRSDFDGDSGASRAVMASLLTALSDETRRGRSLLIGSTNCVWRMSAAMRSRFCVMPVLHPLEEDFADILVATAKRIEPSAQLDSASARIREAGGVFFEKGANPRDVRGALSEGLLRHGTLSEDAVLFAARDFCGTTDRTSAVYADLWSIRACSSQSFLPWAADPARYPFPAHFKDVVNTATGVPDMTAIDRRLAEMRPYANV